MPRKIIHIKKKPSSQVNCLTKLPQNTRNRTINGEASKNRSEEPKIITESQNKLRKYKFNLNWIYSIDCHGIGKLVRHPASASFCLVLPRKA